ncbi:hypothetical protein NFI96_007304, partial [Prochilodus magdalenae]
LPNRTAIISQAKVANKWDFGLCTWSMYIFTDQLADSCETIVYAQQYQGRTEIQENSCSLILSQVRTSDEGEYTCYHKAETFSDVHTTLQVTGPDFRVLTGPKGYWYVLVVLAVCGSLLVLLIPLSVWLIKRRKRTNELSEVHRDRMPPVHQAQS